MWTYLIPFFFFFILSFESEIFFFFRASWWTTIHIKTYVDLFANFCRAIWNPVVIGLHFLHTFLGLFKVLCGALGFSRQWPYDLVSTTGLPLWLQYIFPHHPIDIYFFQLFDVLSAAVVLLFKCNFQNPLGPIILQCYHTIYLLYFLMGTCHFKYFLLTLMLRVVAN